MHPTDGTYRLKADPPETFDVQGVVSGDSLTMSFGVLTYDQANDWFVSEAPDIVIRCTGEGRFEAVWNYGKPTQRTFAGDCFIPAG